MSEEGSKDEPKIGARVKFWQEQDRINRELIPRVIKNHELLAKHVESHEDGDSLARAQIERLEGRVAEIDSLARAQIERLEGRVAEIDSLTKAETERLEGRVNEIDSLTKAETERLEGRVAEIDSLTKAETERLEGRVNEIERSAREALTRWLPHAAFALAAVALVLALAR